MSPRRAILTFRVVFVAFIAWASANSWVRIHAAHQGHAGLLHQGLCALEIAAALLFLFRPLQRVGLTLLLAVFAVAGVAMVSGGELPFQLIYYAATALFISFIDRSTPPSPAPELETAAAPR